MFKERRYSNVIEWFRKVQNASEIRTKLGWSGLKNGKTRQRSFYFYMVLFRQL